MKCTSCRQERVDTDFSFKNKAKGLRHSRCKICVRSSIKKHYLANPDKYKKKALINNKTYIKRNKQFVFNYLKTHPCVDCGETNPVVLEFDHVKGKKKFEIGVMKRESGSIEAILEEISKCEVRCANCHKIKTAKQFNFHKGLV